MDPEVYQDMEEDTGFTWEVKANSRAFNQRFKEKVFLCWTRHKYKTNVIHTAKYNFFSFLPLNLFEQFQRMSNLYFLLIIILQGIPEISTLPWFTLFAPLVCLISLRAARDLVDDIGRHRSDRIVNRRPCKILVGKSFLWRRWMNLCVGDLVCLHKDNTVPADLLLLVSTEPSSLCYVETADIDGETNLKFRQAPMVTHHALTSVRNIANFQGKVVCEEPNSRMHHFVGCLEWKGHKYPLDSGNILLRGCKIRNTDTCYGMVVYAGFDTKIMRNCGDVRLKRTKIDVLMNRLVVLIFLLLVLVSLLLTVGFWDKVREVKAKHHYLWASHPRSAEAESFLLFWGFLILLSVMVPMAMFIMAEFVHLGNSVFIGWDAELLDAERGLWARARSTSLSNGLGQVQHVFSDKTGTLTRNVMTFNKCCVAGRVYGPDEEAASENPYAWNKFADGKLRFFNRELLTAVRTGQDPSVQEFWRLLALCHTVMAQEKDDQLVYQAASPDEEALVTAARNFGFVFLARTQDSITLVELGEQRVYQVLAMMDFNSVRKRMSVLVRDPEGTIVLYTKGADTVIFERLRRKGVTEWNTEEALASFAQQTLRTLCLAYKKVDKSDFESWHQRHQEASIMLHNRAQALQQVYEEMERDLQLLGATAIEDRLQDGVPETIQCLKEGNIKVWVLTGDKQETAVNIGFACQLLSEDMLILEEKDILQILEAYWESNGDGGGGEEKRSRLKNRLPAHLKMAMVLNGDFLDQLLHRDAGLPGCGPLDSSSWQEPGPLEEDALGRRKVSLLWRALDMPLRGAGLGGRDPEAEERASLERRQELAFVDLAARCQAVLCCRVTPQQKALVVALVKKHLNVVTLAIGDGANDIHMIKTADIGVGLAGAEGMQAVQSSDYVLAQFRFLRRLLLVHGRWSYLRVCKFLRYFFYKTVASMLVQVWFAFYSGFSAQPLYEGWFLALFNLLYSTLPVLYIGLFEQDVSAEESMRRPELYVAGQRDELFNLRVFLRALAHGAATSMVNFFFTLGAGWDSGPLHSYQAFAEAVAMSCLLSVTVEVVLIIRYWTVLALLALGLSLGAYVTVTWATQSYWLFRLSPKTFPFLYVDFNVLREPCTFLVVLLNVAVNTLPVLALRLVHKALRKPRRKVEVPVPIPIEEPVPYLRRDTRARRSSYAFSHREGYADLITQGTILRRSGGMESDILRDPGVQSDVDLGPEQREPRQWLGRRWLRPRGRVSSDHTQSSVSSSMTKERPKSPAPRSPATPEDAQPPPPSEPPIPGSPQPPEYQQSSHERLLQWDFLWPLVWWRRPTKEERGLALPKAQPQEGADTPGQDEGGGHPP
ncbi:phospholipid-transporting ATPase IK isoform X2 [Erinaceus europaeus]|uniref:Phospholipid-transporting ATPase n=1 Tax=Erinaceus europaeus TaxID=9365 RepID=A0ABM3WMW4_ERIEU|nr:phospholipid-transporting ATPase IK isoform X2 [Erinaceus europaeus]